MRRRPPRIVAAAAVVVLGGVVTAVVSAGRSGAPSRPVVADRRPCAEPIAITQTPTGQVDGCLAVGSLRRGRYAVSLQDVVWPVTRPPGAASQRHVAAVHLTPSSGPAGTVVTLHVTLRRPMSARARRDVTRLGTDVLGMVDWDGPGGLMLDAAHFRWTSTRGFSAQVTVPRAPWIEAGHNSQVLGLRSGSFPISVTCIGNAAGCAAVPEGEAAFALRVSRPPGWCETASTCSALAVYPRRVPPGALVRVSGHLPLAEFDNGGNSFFGHAEITSGSSQASGLSLRQGMGQAPTEYTAVTPLEVVAGRTLASLGTLRPRNVVASGQAEIASDPADPRIVAWCGKGVIDVSVHGRIEHVSTAPVAAVLRRLGGLAHDGYPMPPSCVDVMPLGAGTVLAAFSGGLPRFHDQLPPIFFYALTTRNRGRSWTPLPVPRGSQPAFFGGFRHDGGDAVAVYARAVRSTTALAQATRPLAERTANGGASWSPTRLGCPGTGPCVTLGPFLPGNCAQGISTQFVLRSVDAGRDWRRSPILDANAFACGDVQLASGGNGRELLVNALSTYPLQLSSDGGVSWGDLSMPVPARINTPPNDLNDFGPGGITLLPDGALLLSGGGSYSGGWQLLRPGARGWCEVAGRHGTWQFAPQASRLTVIGGELWWLTWGNTPRRGATPVHVHRLRLSAVRCAQDP
jgi:hypothetical protein